MNEPRKLPSGLKRWDIFYHDGDKMSWAFDVVAFDKKHAIHQAHNFHWKGVALLPSLKAQLSSEQVENPVRPSIPVFAGRA